MINLSKKMDLLSLHNSKHITLKLFFSIGFILIFNNVTSKAASLVYDYKLKWEKTGEEQMSGSEKAYFLNFEGVQYDDDLLQIGRAHV